MRLGSSLVSLDEGSTRLQGCKAVSKISKLSAPHIYYINFPSAPVHLLDKIYYINPLQRVTFDQCVRAAACAAGAFFFSLFSAFTGVSAAALAGGVGGACDEECSAVGGLP